MNAGAHECVQCDNTGNTLAANVMIHAACTTAARAYAHEPTSATTGAAVEMLTHGSELENPRERAARRAPAAVLQDNTSGRVQGV